MAIYGKAIKLGDNVDTDVILPGQYLVLTDTMELAKHAMEGLDKDFINHVKKNDIIVAGENFGCGSSREHAVWALKDYGFSVIIAPSFADIFYSNCFKNGILPIKVDEKTIKKLNEENLELEVDLEKQLLITNNQKIPFDIDAYQKKILLEGLDDIALTLQFEEKISEFEKKSKIPSVL